MNTERTKAMIICDLFQSEEFHENVRYPIMGMEYSYDAMKEILVSLRGVNCPTDEKDGAFPIMNKDTAKGRVLMFFPYEDNKGGVKALITKDYIRIKVPNVEAMYIRKDGKEQDGDEE